MSAPAIDPRLQAALQAQAQGPAQGPQQPQAPQQGYGNEPIDLEGCIARAIEAGCELAAAATAPPNSEDFLRFAQGVNQLALAMKALQPAPDPSAPPAPTPAHEVAQATASTLKTLAEAHRALRPPPPPPPPGAPPGADASRPTGPGN